MTPMYIAQLFEMLESDLLALGIFAIGFILTTIAQRWQAQRKARAKIRAKAAHLEAKSSCSEVDDSQVQRLKTLCANRRLDEAARLLKSSVLRERRSFHYNTVLEAHISYKDLTGAEQLLSDAVANGAADIVSYNTVIKAFLNNGEFSRARKIQASMFDRGLAPNCVTFNEFLDATIGNGATSATWRIVDEMKACNVKPNHVTASILLKLVQPGVKNAHIERAMGIVDEIDDEMDEVLLGSVIEACIRVDRRDFLMEHLRRYRSSRQVKMASGHTFGSMIRAFGFVQDLGGVWQTWNEMRALGVPLTSITLGNMVEALVVNGDPDAAFKVICESKRNAESRSAVNAVAYGSVLKGYSAARNMGAVWAVYQDMLAGGTPLSMVTYNTIVNACCRCHEMDRIPSMLEKMAQDRIKPDTITFSAIIKGYCQRGQVDHAFEILETMQQENLKADEFTYNTLIDGCARQGQYARGMRVLEQMQDAGMPPSNFTLSVLVKLASRGKRLERAFELCEQISHSQGFALNIHVFNNLVQACIHHGDIERGISVLASMARGQILPDQRTYRLLLHAAARAPDVEGIAGLLRAAAGLSPNHRALADVDASALRPVGGLPSDLISEALESVAAARSDGAGALAMKLLVDLRAVPMLKVDSNVATRIAAKGLRGGMRSGTHTA